LSSRAGGLNEIFLDFAVWNGKGSCDSNHNVSFFFFRFCSVYYSHIHHGN
jgi:hypothetical protein